MVEVLHTNGNIFLGIPELLEKAFNNLGESLFCVKDFSLHASEIYFNTDELSLTSKLNRQ